MQWMLDVVELGIGSSRVSLLPWSNPDGTGSGDPAPHYQDAHSASLPQQASSASLKDDRPVLRAWQGH